MCYLRRPLAWLTCLWLAACSYYCAISAKPSRDHDVPAWTPVGTYWSHHGGQLRYTVTIRKTDAGPIVSQWVSTRGTLDYVGTWVLHPDGLWRERYADHPTLARCQPWVWRILSESPSALEDTAGVDAGWSLTQPNPDF